MYLDGKRIRSSVPKLPEAKEPYGITKKEGKLFHLLAIGESTIAGVGVNRHKDGFTGTFAKTISSKLNRPVQWEVVAKNGVTAFRTRSSLIPKIEPKAYDLILIGLGGNDAFTLTTPWAWRKHIRLLIEEMRSKFPETPIAFLNMPPIKEFPAFTPLIKATIGNLVELHGQMLEKEVMLHSNVYYNKEIITLDYWLAQLNGADRPSDYFSDGVHPSKLTYQTWAKEMVDFVIKNDCLR